MPKQTLLLLISSHADLPIQKLTHIIGKILIKALLIGYLLESLKHFCPPLGHKPGTILHPPGPLPRRIQRAVFVVSRRLGLGGQLQLGEVDGLDGF